MSVFSLYWQLSQGQMADFPAFMALKSTICTLKKVVMDLPSSMAETNKGEIGLYSRNDKKNPRWHHMSKISKRNA